MNPTTQHDPAGTRTPGPGCQTAPPAHHHRRRSRHRMRTTSTAAGIFGAAAIAAVLLGNAPPAAATPPPGSPRFAADPSASIPANGRLEATFTSTAVSVTPKLGMVELILTGAGTVQGFGAATEVIGVVEDRTVSPCGAGGASDSAQRRIVLAGGVLALHEAAMLCPTASGPQVTGTYRVDGQASTGIFAGARGTGQVTVDVTTGHEAVSGTLIGVLGSTGSGAPQDSGLVACAYPLATQDVPAADYPKLRAEFAGSRFADLRTAGTAYADLAVALPTARGTDGYQTVWFYQRLSAACAKHGR
jgi:hypothetical protein